MLNLTPVELLESQRRARAIAVLKRLANLLETTLLPPPDRSKES
jgi:hypothetical protein